MFTFEDIIKIFCCRKLIHIASQLCLFEINQSKINSVVGLQCWTTKNGPKLLFRRYWVKERRELFTHGSSFKKKLIWAILSKWAKSERVNSQPCTKICTLQKTVYYLCMLKTMMMFRSDTSRLLLTGIRLSKKRLPPSGVGAHSTKQCSNSGPQTQNRLQSDAQ